VDRGYPFEPGEGFEPVGRVAKPALSGDEAHVAAPGMAVVFEDAQRFEALSRRIEPAGAAGDIGAGIARRVFDERAGQGPLLAPERLGTVEGFAVLCGTEAFGDLVQKRFDLGFDFAGLINEAIASHRAANG